MSAIWDRLAAAKVYDLGQPYFTGMPHWPSHPPYLYSMTKQHGDVAGAAGNSSASDAIALGSHVGTHIDALCHFSCGGRLYGGDEVAGVQSYSGGVQRHAIDTVPPILRRGVLIDLAAEGPLPEDREVTPDQLQAACRTRIRPGDVVLIRTGWGSYFADARKFVNGSRCPGPGLEAARWLSAHGVFAAGSDTAAFEKVPSSSMPVHVHLLVECGIHILECLNLESLAADGVTEFGFVAVPMKLRGATGAPVRPLALV
jgi:kynurenine formamidase